jgi:hypothetical protein
MPVLNINGWAVMRVAQVPATLPALSDASVEFIEQLSAGETLAEALVRARSSSNPPTFYKNTEATIVVNGPANWGGDGGDRFQEMVGAIVRLTRPGWLSQLGYSRAPSGEVSLHAVATEPIRFAVTLPNGDPVPGAGNWTLAYQNGDRQTPYNNFTDRLPANPATNNAGGLLTGLAYSIRLTRQSQPTDVFVFTAILDTSDTAGNVLSFLLPDDEITDGGNTSAIVGETDSPPESYTDGNGNPADNSQLPPQESDAPTNGSGGEQ